MIDTNKNLTINEYNNQWYAVIDSITNKVINISEFAVQKSDYYYSVIITSKTKQLIENSLNDIEIRPNCKFNLSFFDTDHFTGEEFIFHIITSNKELNNEIKNLKIEYLKKHIEGIKKINIQNGIIFKYRNIIVPILYTEQEKEKLLKPIINLSNVSFENNKNEIMLTKFEYNRLLKELTNMETFNNVYANCFQDYLIKNIENFNVDSDYIYYGYMNEEIAKNIKLKLKEMNLDEIYN